ARVATVSASSSRRWSTSRAATWPSETAWLGWPSRSQIRAAWRSSASASVSLPWRRCVVPRLSSAVATRGCSGPSARSQIFSARGADLRLRLREAALHPVEEREVALRETDAQVAGPEAQGDPQPALDQRLGLRIAALLVGLSRLAEQRRELALVERLAEGNGGHHEEGEERGAGDARHDRHLTSACGRRPHLQWFRMKPARIFAGSVGLREAASVVFALTAL